MLRAAVGNEVPSFFSGQQCYRVGIDPNGFDWQHKWTARPKR